MLLNKVNLTRMPSKPTGSYVLASGFSGNRDFVNE
jgi:hypothetical protein